MNYQQWERENASKYKGERVQVKGHGFSVHRFNPNIVAISLIVTEEIGGEQSLIRRVVTSVFSSHDRPYFRTSCDTTKIIKGKVSNDSSHSSFTADYREFDKAVANHEKMVQNLQNSVKNPKWRVASVTHYTLAKDWSVEESAKYNLAYGLAVYQRLLDNPSNSYTKTSATEARWSDKEPLPLSADFWVLVNKSEAI